MNITPGGGILRELGVDAARDMWPLSKQNVTISKWSMFEIEQSIQMRHGMQRQINPNLNLKKGNIYDKKFLGIAVSVFCCILITKLSIEREEVLAFQFRH